PNAVGRELVEACMRDDRRAQQRLYETVHARLMNVCLRYTRDEEEARSHFINGFMKILSNLRHYSFDGPFEPWAARVMINATIDTLRQRKRYTQNITVTEAENIQAPDVSWNEFEQRAAADDLLSLVKRLPDASRAVFMMFAVDGYAHAEIAALLGISEGTSKWHVSDARKRLTAMIAEQQKRNYNHGTQR
ncbi:MAG TPA: RNA polymerase sigma factor, partial [Chitinophagales bacterium]|nr:RNA polymerase sigma factor [Chitinophagales bacterium]